MDMLNVRAPPKALPDALGHAIQRAVIKHQRKRDECEAGAGKQFERFSLLSQQDIAELR